VKDTERIWKNILSFGPSTRFWVVASTDGVSRSHTLDKPYSVVLLWRRDQPHAKTSIW